MGATRSIDRVPPEKICSGYKFGSNPMSLFSSLFTTIPPLHPSTTSHTMYQPQLPPECVLGVIHILFNEHDTDTMASLLRVNKTICAATLQFLYKDCFSLMLKYFYGRHFLEGPKLVRTLLRQVHPQNRVPDILKVAFLSPDDQTDVGSTAQPPPPPVFKYGRVLSRVDVEFDFIHPMFIYICDSSRLMNYAATNRLYEKYKDVGYIANNVNSRYKDISLLEALKVDIYHQLT